MKIPNMKKMLIMGSATLWLLNTGCVTQRKYQDLEAAHAKTQEEKAKCDELLADANNRIKDMRAVLEGQEARISHLKSDSIETHSLFESNKKLYGELKESYETLLKNNKIEEDRMRGSLRELEAKLVQREKDLSDKEARLNENTRKNENLKVELEALQKDLMKQQVKVKELQTVLESKDSTVKALRTKIENALLGFKDRGLSVEVKNGKVYVSLDEKLLFASGSIVVDKKGRDALLQLAASIREMEDITIMVEGHTDDVPMSSGQIKDNWDLSVLRATSIVRLLTKDGNVNPQRFVAAGRGEFMPVEMGKTPEARAKNRRTEIIISPKLDEIFKMLE